MQKIHDLDLESSGISKMERSTQAPLNNIGQQQTTHNEEEKPLAVSSAAEVIRCRGCHPFTLSNRFGLAGAATYPWIERPSLNP